MFFQDDDRNAPMGPGSGGEGSLGQGLTDTYDPENLHETVSDKARTDGDNRDRVREKERDLYKEEEGAGGIGRAEPDDEDRDDDELNISE